MTDPLRRHPARAYHRRMRVAAVDVGLRRIGLAVSDPTASLARPLDVLHLASGEVAEAAAAVAARLAEFLGEEDGLSAIVVGLPRRLDGSAHEMTAWARAFGDALADRTRLPVVYEDERLTSREAESRLAGRYRDWRDRKAKIDAVAAAIVLQDHLDRRAPDGARTPDATE